MNPDSSTRGTSVRFGESFELDLDLKQLRRYGQVVRLERIPLEILIVLIEKGTEIVSREEIVARVWGEGTFLDTDNGINGGIRKIRQVLRDNPEQPKYIQTITGKGYRFIAEVQAHLSAEPEPVDIQPSNPFSKFKMPAWLSMAGVALTSIIAVLAFFVFHSKNVPAPGGKGKYMLAVLPFENLTGDPSQDYFSDGLTEEMISHLGNLDPEHLGIIARTSVMQYKNSKDGLDRIGKELGVQYALEGSVRRESGKVRITAQLIQLKDQTHLWARQYDRELNSLLRLEDEIASEVAQEIQITLVNGRGGSVATPNQVLSPDQYAAYDSYLRGRYFWNKRTEEGFKLALKSFEQSIARDPNYARAYVGLADTYALISGYDLAPKTETLPKARAAAAKALELDDNLAEAHTSMAMIAQNYEWNWKKAESEYRRAIHLDPNYATAHHWYAEFLSVQGRFTEALEEIEHARQLDPRSLIIAADRGAILYCARRYDEAVTQSKQVLEMERDFPRAHIIVFAYSEQGKFDAALKDIAESPELQDGPFTWMLNAYAHGRAGHKTESQRFIRRLESERSKRYINSGKMIIAYLGYGDREQALNWIEKGLDERSSTLVYLKVDPVYDPLRSEPRFQAVLSKLNFE